MISLRIDKGGIVVAGNSLTTIFGAECLRQRLQNKISLMKREWFLGPDEGIDWLTILSRKSSARLVYSEIERILRTDEEVTAVGSIDMTSDGSTRKLSVSFEAETIYGSIKGGTAI